MKRLALLPAFVLLAACADTVTEPSAQEQPEPTMALLSSSPESQGQVIQWVSLSGLGTVILHDGVSVFCQVWTSGDAPPDWNRLDASGQRRMVHREVNGNLLIWWVGPKPDGAPGTGFLGEPVGTGHATLNVTWASDGSLTSSSMSVEGWTDAQQVRCRSVQNQDGVQVQAIEWTPAPAGSQ